MSELIPDNETNPNPNTLTNFFIQNLAQVPIETPSALNPEGNSNNLVLSETGRIVTYYGTKLKIQDEYTLAKRIYESIN